jgi:sirohydrochlorin ferrochelatase
MKTAVIILGHGSRRSGAGDPLQALADAVRQRGSYAAVEHAFIQHASPTFAAAVNSSLRQGAERIVVVPFFVQPGNHVTQDIPRMVGEAQRTHPSVAFAVTDHVGAHPMMAQIVEDLVGKSDAERL